LPDQAPLSAPHETQTNTVFFFAKLLPAGFKK